MKRSPLRLGFVRGATRPAGWVLALAGVAAAVCAGGLWQMGGSLRLLAQEQAAAQAGSKQPPAAATSPRKVVDAALLLRNRQAMQASAKQRQPWEPLLSTLEALSTPKVALLSVEPTPQKGTLRIVAEAATADDMLDYLGQLQQSDLFTDLGLVAHQVLTQRPGMPIRLQILGTWKAQP